MSYPPSLFEEALGQAEQLKQQGFEVQLSPVYQERLQHANPDDWDFADLLNSELLSISKSGIKVAAYTQGNRHLKLYKNKLLAEALGSEDWELAHEWIDELISEPELCLFKHFSHDNLFELLGVKHVFYVVNSGWFENVLTTNAREEVVSDAYYEVPLPRDLEAAWQYEYQLLVHQELPEMEEVWA